MAPKIKSIFGTVDRGKVGAEVPYSDLIPETYFRNSLDLNRFENKVSKELIQSYNRIIIDSVRKLEAIERLPKANQPKYTAARLRSLLAQTKKSLEGWSNSSSRELIKDLDGIAKLQSEFVEEQLKKVLPAGMRSSVRSVEVSPKFAEAVVRNKATDINANVLSDDLQAAVKGVDGLRQAQGSFNLTAKMGSKITLPNGDIVSKAFRGLAEKNADLFGRTIRDGLLSGETTQQVGRRLLGQLYFGEKARTAKQLALAGGEATRMANHQISTLVRTSIQQVSDTAAQSVYKQNSDITQSYKWLATLDSRTAPQCMALDQKVFKYGQGPTPPQHFNCRCRTVATIDYEGLDIPPPNFTRSTRAAVGGPVPTGTSYGSWLQKQPPQMRAKILGGKQVTLASGKKVWRGKFQYFDKLSKKVGPDQAIAKFVSSDGSEKSLKQLQKAYGKPSNIKPKTSVKTLSNTKSTTGTWAPTSDFREGIKRGESMTKGRFEKTKGLSAKYKKAFTEYQDAQEDYFTYRFDNVYTGGLSYDEAAEIYKKGNISKKAKWLSKKEAMQKIEKQGAKEMGILRKELLKTNVSDNAIKESLDKIPFVNKTKELQLGVRKDIEEFAKMFNGGGVTIKPERLSSGGQITKVKLGTSRAYNSLGEILVPFGDPTNIAKTLKAKQTIFHEVGHSLEKITNKNLDMSVGWRSSRVTSNIATKAKTKVKRAWTLKEKVLPDEFIDPYVGRPYYQFGVDRATEVVSMGVEHFATPELMFRLYTIDPDHFHMVLSLTRNVY